MIHKIQMDSEKLLKFLKLFKLGGAIHLRVRNGTLRCLNVDFKDFSGVLEGVLRLDKDQDSEAFDFSMDPSLLLNKLESFKQKVRLEVNDVYSNLCVKSLEKKSYVYVLECSVGPKVTKVLDLNLLESEDMNSVPTVSFRMNTEAFLQTTKAVTAVDNLVVFRFTKEDSTVESILTTKRTNNLSTDLLSSDKLKDLKYNSERDVFLAEIYYPTGVFNTFLKPSKEVLLSFRSDFLVLEVVPLEDSVSQLKVYVPIRKSEHER